MHEPTDLVDQIRTLQRAGAHGRAVALVRHALAVPPRAPGTPCPDMAAKLHYLAGLSLDAQGRGAEAATHYARAMDRVMDRLTAQLAAADGLAGAPSPEVRGAAHDGPSLMATASTHGEPAFAQRRALRGQRQPAVRGMPPPRPDQNVTGR